MCQTLLESHCLNIQDLIAAAFSLFFDPRYEWSGIKFAGKRCYSSACIKINFVIKNILSFRCKIRYKAAGRHPSSLIIQSVDIQIRIKCAIDKASTLCKYRAVFCDQIVAAVDNILGGFSLSCCRIDISAEKSC